MSGQRRVLTWTLRAGAADYEQDLEKYGNKIFALGVHEIQVEKTGRCYIRREIPSGYDGTDYGTYTYGGGKVIATARDYHKNSAWWRAIEKGMRRWDHIRHYLSFILFGASRVTPMLDNVNNAQDIFIEECAATIDNFMKSVNYPDDNHFVGIEIDFEASIRGGDYDYRDGDNQKYVDILRRVKEEVCIPRGLILQINAYAMWGKDTPFYYRFHDYEMFAQARDSRGNALIDELQIMCYDFAWNGSAPGASTPLWWFDNVSNWAKECFNAEKGAALTIDNVYIGAAGYGHRWGIYDIDRMYGSTITYRNFIDWQNGLYKHNRSTGTTGSDGQTIYEWHDQEFLMFAATEDQESKNQILLQHVYDYFKARYGEISIVDGAYTARIASYNGGEYATTYSRVQKAEFTNIKAETFAPSAEVKVGTNIDIDNGIVSTPITIKENGVVRTKTGIVGRKLKRSQWLPKTITTPEGTQYTCEKQANSTVTYDLNIPAAGSYKLIALVQFTWYNSARLSCSLNGSPFLIQPHADYYPLMFKASHWFDCGVKTFQAGSNKIVIDGDGGMNNTPIYGFIVCEDFKPNFGGGEISFLSTVRPMKKKDGSFAAIPSKLSVTTKALRQKAIPLMMWEDRFSHYRRKVVGGEVVYEDVPDITAFPTYYAKYTESTAQGNGSTLSADKLYCYDPNNPTTAYGYAWGVWAIRQNPLNGEPDDAYAAHESMDGRGRLLVNNKFGSNTQVECELRSTGSRGIVGIQFAGEGSVNGYLFMINYNDNTLKLVHDMGDAGETVIASEPIPATHKQGDRTKLTAILHNGQAYLYFGYSSIKAFGGQTFTLNRTSGGVCGAYANLTTVRVYMLKVSTTDKWDLMEKFTVEAEVSGQKYTQQFGEVSRSKYSIDPQFGYLNYSGINELNSRDALPVTGSDGETEFVREDISLDYDFFICEIPGVEGDIPIKVRFDDPGAWLGHIYVVDRAGGSVTWCGDSYSFLDSMNRATNEIGAKGIGFWTMGQEDPRVFETIPEIVPYHD